PIDIGGHIYVSLFVGFIDHHAMVGWKCIGRVCGDGLWGDGVMLNSPYQKRVKNIQKSHLIIHKKCIQFVLSNEMLIFCGFSFPIIIQFFPRKKQPKRNTLIIIDKENSF
ncbi:MAG: hypothetical protein LAT80_13390, partial [Balneolaceae bacterium]|nr:hypothetical protein [Balneolaceae bacterium]